MFNHDTGKWEFSWTTLADGSTSSSIMAWSDKKYITWLQEAVAKTGKLTKDNTHMWKNKIQYSTLYKK